MCVPADVDEIWSDRGRWLKKKRKERKNKKRKKRKKEREEYNSVDMLVLLL